MPFITKHQGKLEYLTSSLIPVPHAFSTRYGGVSEGYLASLNLGPHRGDKLENVVENYRILGEAVGFQPEDTVFTWQEHTDIVLRVGRNDRGTGLFREQETICDGLVTNEPGVALCAFSADCGTILLYDPVKGAIAAVHAGWRGTAAGIVKTAAGTMAREFGSRPQDIRAAIGPCISKCCFETDGDVPAAMLSLVGPEAAEAIEKTGEKYHVDLKWINGLWLRRAGVTQIDVSDACTACEPERFWSYRRAGGHRGSLCAVIVLPKEN
jgi:YfiH family protein